MANSENENSASIYWISILLRQPQVPPISCVVILRASCLIAHSLAEEETVIQ